MTILRRQKSNVGSIDMKIAAIAMEHSIPVITRNRRDFLRVPDLSVEDWIAENLGTIAPPSNNGNPA